MNKEIMMMRRTAKSKHPHIEIIQEDIVDIREANRFYARHTHKVKYYTLDELNEFMDSWGYIHHEFLLKGKIFHLYTLSTKTFQNLEEALTEKVYQVYPYMVTRRIPQPKKEKPYKEHWVRNNTKRAKITQKILDEDYDTERIFNREPQHQSPQTNKPTSCLRDLSKARNIHNSHP